MAAINYLTLRSTLYYTAPGSIAAPSSIFTVASDGQAKYASTIAVKGLAVASTSINMGTSTNMTYSNLSSGSYASTSWVTSLTGLTSTNMLEMNSNGTTQYVLQSNASTIKTTTNSGLNWSTLTTNLPTGPQVSYPSLATSATGQYLVAPMKGGQVYTSNNYGQSFSTIGAPSIYLPFEGSAADTMGNVSTIVVGAPSYVSSCAVGTQSIYFNNTNSAPTQGIYIPWTGVGATSFTISFWFYPMTLSASSNQVIMANQNGSMSIVINTSNKLMFYIPNGGSYFNTPITTSYALTANTWYQVMGTFTTNGTCSLYVNNALIGSIAQTGGIGSYFANLWLGMYSTIQGYNGYIDDFKIYTNAIQTPPVQTTVYFPFDGNTVDYMGGVVTTTGTPTYVTDSSGTPTHAVYLSNTAGGTAGQYVRVPLAMSTQPNFTVSFAFQALTLPTSGQSCIFCAGASPQEVFLMALSTAGGLSFQYESGAGSWTSVALGTITAATWYSVRITYVYGGASYVYLNGTQVGASFTPVTVYVAPTTLSIGCFVSSAAAAFNGYIDEFRFTVQPTIYLPMDGSYADAMGVSTVTAAGAPGFVAGVVGAQALYLNNTAGNTANQYLTMPITMTQTPAFTMSFWFNAQAIPSSIASALVTIGTTSLDSLRVWINTSSVLNFSYQTGPIAWATTSMGSISTSKWYNVQIAYTYGGYCYLYVNGLIVATLTVNFSLYSAAPNLLSIGKDIALSGSNACNVYVDDFKIYNYVVPNTTTVQPTIYLPFESTTPYVDAMGSATITATGSPATVTGQVGSKALNLANTAGAPPNQYLRGTWGSQTSFTVSFWFNVQSYQTGVNASNAQIIFSAYSGNLVVYIDSNKYFRYYNAGNGGTMYSGVISLNTWNHGMLTYALNGTAVLYLNGTSVGSVGTGASLPGTNSNLFGLGTYDNLATQSFNGYIDDVRIYNSVVPLSTVFAPVTAGLYVPTGSQIYLPFDGTVADSFGGAVTAYGSPAFIAGVNGNAINLANTAGGTAAQFVVVPVTLTTSPNFTISFWFNPQTTGVQQVIAGAYGVTFQLLLFANNQLGMYVPLGGGTTIIRTSTTVSAGTWYNFTCVYQHYGTSYMYLNGVLMGTYTNSGSFNSGNSNFSTLTIGGCDIGITGMLTQAFNGYIDDFRFTNTALTQYTYPIPFACTQTAVSGTGQYMLAAAVGGGLFQSSNYGASWSQVLSTLQTIASIPWTAVSMSNSGQYMLAMGGGMTTPNLSGLAANSWWQNGVQWTASTSTNYSGSFSPYMLFDNNTTSSSWASVYPSYNGAGNTYSNSVLTTVLGMGAILGDWVQLQLSVPAVLQSYKFTCGAIVIKFPVTYYIVGSTDGSNWYPIQYANITTTPFLAGWNTMGSYIMTNQSGAQTIVAGQAGSITTTIYGTTTNAYSYFRMIITVVGGGGLAEIGEFLPVFTAGESYSTNYGATWNPVATYGSDAFNIVKSATLTKSLSSYITMPTFAASSAGVTFSCWFSLPSTPSQWSRIMDFGATTGRNSATFDFGGYYLGIYSGTTLVAQSMIGVGPNPSSSVSEYRIFSPTTLSNNTLYHVVYTINSTGFMTLYLNGTLNASGQGVLNTQSLPYCWLGKSNWSSDPYFDITIADFRMYNRAISATEVAALYATPYALTVANTPTPNMSGLASNTWGQNGVSWTASASSYFTSASLYPYNAFNNKVVSLSEWVSGTSGYNTSTGVYSAGTYSTTIQPSIGATGGEWLQIQSSTPLIMTSYAIASGNVLGRVPKVYYILGSNDGTSWYPLHLCSTTTTPYTTSYTTATYIQVNTTGTQTVTAGQAGSVTTTAYSYATSAWSYFRMVVTTVWSGDGYLEMGEFYPIFTNPTTYIAPTTSLANVVQPQQTGLAAATWTQAGVGWTSSASTNTSASYYGFNNNYAASNSWTSSGLYNASGAYTASVSTTVLGGLGALTGEWIQLQSSTPQVMTSYTFASSDYWPSCPSSYYIVGSTDGTNWYPVQRAVFTYYYLTIGVTACSNYIIVNQSGAQTLIGNNNGTCNITTYSTTTQAYTYFRLIVSTIWGNSVSSNGTAIGEWFINFSNPAPLNTSFTPYSFSAISGNGQYTLEGNGQSAWLTTNTPSGLSANTATLLTLPGINAVINCASISTTGQYMTILTQGTTNNVFYSMNYGAAWTALTIGNAPMTSCAMSYDGSYLTVSNATTVYTLNLNSQGYTVAIGNQAGQTNQGANAIAIGNQAGQTSQSANSIVLNATGAAMNAYEPGFFVGPIANSSTSSQTIMNLLGYGADCQVTQTPIVLNPSGAMTIYGTGTASASNSSITLDCYPSVITAGGLVGSFAAKNAGTLAGSVNIISGIGLLNNNGGLTFNTTMDYNNINVERMRIDRSGNVGIGTNTPASTLHLWSQAAQNTSPVITLSGFSNAAGTGPRIEMYAWNNAATQQSRIETIDDGNYGGWLIFSTKGDSSNAAPLRETMRMGGANNYVGIGTASPSKLLEVYSTGTGVTTQVNIFSDASAGTTTNVAALNLRVRGAGNGIVDNLITGQFNGTGSGTYSIAINPGNAATPAITALGTGNVGIGKTNPSTTLDVNGTVTGGLFTTVISYPTPMYTTNVFTIVIPYPATYLFTVNTGGASINGGAGDALVKAIMYITIGASGTMVVDAIRSVGVQINSYTTSNNQLSYNIGYAGQTIYAGIVCTVSAMRLA